MTTKTPITFSCIKNYLNVIHSNMPYVAQTNEHSMNNMFDFRLNRLIIIDNHMDYRVQFGNNFHAIIPKIAL